MGRHPMKADSECLVTDQYPFGAMVEYHPISAKDQSKLHRGENLERRHYHRRHCRIGGDGRIRTSRLKAQCKGCVTANER